MSSLTFWELQCFSPDSHSLMSAQNSSEDLCNAIVPRYIYSNDRPIRKIVTRKQRLQRIYQTEKETPKNDEELNCRNCGSDERIASPSDGDYICTDCGCVYAVPIFCELSPFFGDLVIATTIDAACGLLTMEPVRPTFVIFTLMRYFLHFCVLGLGFLIQICESYETSSKQKISSDQASRISNLFARKSTSDSGSGDSVRNTPKSGPRSFTDTAGTNLTTCHKRSSNLCAMDFDCCQDAGTMHRLCS